MTFFKILFQRLFFPKLSQISNACLATYCRPFWSADSSFADSSFAIRKLYITNAIHDKEYLQQSDIEIPSATEIYDALEDSEAIARV